jgi:hypothetical protein
MALDEIPELLLASIDGTITQLTKKEISIEEFDGRMNLYAEMVYRLQLSDDAINDFDHLYSIVKEDYIAKNGA